MIIIVGLGNPGEKFIHTRHNAGFMAVDFFAKHHTFPEFSLSKKYYSMITEATINGEKVLLAKPQTFMNESGKAVQAIMKHANSSTLLVIHDDIDLPLGTIKVVKGRGSAGHKGIESIIQNIGNDNLMRLRIGIQPEGGKPNHSEKFVVQHFTKEEDGILNSTIKKTAKALDFFVEHGLEKTMNEYNK